jgi:hypothetical protein
MLPFTVEVVIGLIEPCGKVNGRPSGFPASSKKFMTAPTGYVLRLTSVTVVSQPPAEAI